MRRAEYTSGFIWFVITFFWLGLIVPTRSIAGEPWAKAAYEGLLADFQDSTAVIRVKFEKYTVLDQQARHFTYEGQLQKIFKGNVGKSGERVAVFADYTSIENRFRHVLESFSRGTFSFGLPVVNREQFVFLRKRSHEKDLEVFQVIWRGQVDDDLMENYVAISHAKGLERVSRLSQFFCTYSASPSYYWGVGMLVYYDWARLFRFARNTPSLLGTHLEPTCKKSILQHFNQLSAQTEPNQTIDLLLLASFLDLNSRKECIRTMIEAHDRIVSHELEAERQAKEKKEREKKENFQPDARANGEGRRPWPTKPWRMGSLGQGSLISGMKLLMYPALRDALLKERSFQLLELGDREPHENIMKKAREFIGISGH